MKKIVLPIAMALMVSPMLNALNLEEGGSLCHEIAKETADGYGNEGEQYADDYTAAYDTCESGGSMDEITHAPDQG